VDKDILQGMGMSSVYPTINFEAHRALTYYIHFSTYTGAYFNF